LQSFRDNARLLSLGLSLIRLFIKVTSSGVATRPLYWIAKSIGKAWHKEGWNARKK
jgi:hypothetical protein